MSKKRNNNETNVKYLKSENISLVTGNQVRQFYADEDRDSYKVERSRYFKNNPTPQHHYRYIPERPLSQKKSKKGFCGLNLKAKSKKLISYCLIYILMFTSAITLLYLFYTPKQMNLFGLYANNNLRLKFYRFVLGGNASTTITPKIITTTEPTIFLTHSSTVSSISIDTVTKTKSIKITQRPYSITQPPITKVTSTGKPNLIYTTKISISTKQTRLSTETSLRSEGSSSTTFSPVDSGNSYEEEPGNKKYVPKVKTFTTCVTVNITEPTKSPIDEESQYFSTKSSQSTTPSVFYSTNQPKKLSTKSKIIAILKSTSTTTTTIPSTILSKDNSTESLEFNEKVSYSNTELGNMEKNETAYDETLVDNGILPTDEEEEERKKDEIESKQKIASFFGVDPVTGKEKDDMRGFLGEKQTKSSSFDGVDQMNKIATNGYTGQKQQTDRWILSGNQQFSRNRDSNPTKSPKDDELKYHPMLKLLYSSCYGGCNS